MTPLKALQTLLLERDGEVWHWTRREMAFYADTDHSIIQFLTDYGLIKADAAQKETEKIYARAQRWAADEEKKLEAKRNGH